jgi:hypothetical protein
VKKRSRFTSGLVLGQRYVIVEDWEKRTKYNKRVRGPKWGVVNTLNPRGEQGRVRALEENDDWRVVAQPVAPLVGSTIWMGRANKTGTDGVIVASVSARTHVKRDAGPMQSETQWRVSTPKNDWVVNKSRVNKDWVVVPPPPPRRAAAALAQQAPSRLPSPSDGGRDDRSSIERGFDEAIVGEENCDVSTEEVEEEAAATPAAAEWAALFAPSDFFDRYCDFVEVRIVAALSSSAHSAWLGWCESRLRVLVAELCAVPSLSAGTVHLLAHAFSPPDAGADADADATHFYIGIAPTRAPLELESAEEARRASRGACLGAPVDLGGAWSAFAAQLGAQYPDDGMDLTLSHLAREELPAYCRASALDPLASRGGGEEGAAAAAAAAESATAEERAPAGERVAAKRKRAELGECDPAAAAADAVAAMDVELLLSSIGAPPPRKKEVKNEMPTGAETTTAEAAMIFARRDARDGDGDAVTEQDEMKEVGSPVHTGSHESAPPPAEMI